MIPQDVILYSWLDVEEVLIRAIQEGRFPPYILSVRAYWDSLSIAVAPGNEKAALDWLADQFEPRFDRANSRIDLESEEERRFLPVFVEESDEEPLTSRFKPTFSRPAVLRQRTDYGVATTLSDHPKVVALHSFKGGVGRTVNALGLALALKERKIKVLLIDADLEAPGLTWLISQRMPKPPISYMDLLTLAHGDPDPEASGAIRLVANRLMGLLLDGIYVLPAFRSINKFTSLDIKPEHLIQGSNDPYVLTKLLSRLGKKLGVDLVLVDLRAGLSEISASLLLDPKVYRVLVTTLSSQSLQGTRLMLELLGRMAPSKESDEPFPSLIITQIPDEEREVTLERSLEELSEAFSNAFSDPSDRSSEEGKEPIMVFSDTPFDPRLIVLPDSWEEAVRRIREARLDRDLMEVLDWLPNPPQPRPVLESLQLDEKRTMLAEYAEKAIYAEAGDITDFLRTRPLSRLMSDFSSKVPIAVVIGSKGSGKTLTFLQLAGKKDWSKFCDDLTYSDASQSPDRNHLLSSIKAGILPVIRPMTLKPKALKSVDDSKTYSAENVGLSSPCAWDYILDHIQEQLTQDLHESQWRDNWLNYIAWSAGFDEGKNDAGRRFVNYLREKNAHLVAIIDGLETLFPELASNKKQQLAVRSLLQYVTSWLEQQLSRPLGILVFIRKDMVVNALPQNSAQFMAVFKNYELNWNSEEALRLSAWTAIKAKALNANGNSIIDRLLELKYDELVQMLVPLWGRKLGKEESKEANSANWVIYALSDFNGQIQARDIVRFLHFAAKKSIGDQYWQDRVLIPQAIRSSLAPCSKYKIEEIKEENADLKRIFEKINQIPSEIKRVPFAPYDLELEQSDLEILERNGVISSDGEKYYIPEIFRSGLDFSLGKGARPKVIAMARRAQGLRKNLM